MLLWFDGFEAPKSSSFNDYLARRYDYTGATVGSTSDYAQVTGFNSPYGLHLSGTYNFLKTPPLTTDRTLIAGCHIWLNATNKWMFVFMAQNTWAIGLEVTTSGGLKVYRNDGSSVQLGSTVATTKFRSGRWLWVEAKVYTDNSAGTVEVRIGGKTIFTFTGDTQSGVAGMPNYTDSIGFGSGMATTGVRIDNFYVCDGTSSLNNDFLGQIRVQRFNPSADGDFSQWTPSGGGSHYTLVDDDPSDDDSTYLESSNSGDRELWQYTDASNLGTIRGVNVLSAVRSTDARAVDVKTLAKSGGGSETENTVQTVLSDYAYADRLMQEQPGGGAWTQAALNGYQFGVRVG